jgi:hypothetical protein
VTARLRIVEDWSSFRNASAVAHGADDLRNAVGRGGAFFQHHAHSSAAARARPDRPGIDRTEKLRVRQESLAKYLVKMGSKVLQMFGTLLDAICG